MVHDVGFEGLLCHFASIVAYKHDFNVFLMRVVVGWTREGGVAWCANLDLFDASVPVDFGRLLVVEAVVDDLATYALSRVDHLIVVHELVGTLVGVSQLLVDVAAVVAGGRGRSIGIHYVHVMVVNTADISVGLGHGGNGRDASNVAHRVSDIIAIGHVVPIVVSMLHHCRRVLVSNGTLGRQALLVLDEFSLAVAMLIGLNV